MYRFSERLCSLINCSSYVIKIHTLWAYGICFMKQRVGVKNIFSQVLMKYLMLVQEIMSTVTKFLQRSHHRIKES